MAQLVLKGSSTERIAAALTIFDKVGARSRRALVAHIFAQHHWPRYARELGVAAGAWSAAE